jgi:hypothetical protein
LTRRSGDDFRLTDIPGIGPKIVSGWLLIAVFLWSAHLLAARVRFRDPHYLRLTAYVLIRSGGWMALTWIVFALIDKRPATRISLPALLFKVAPLVLAAVLVELTGGAIAMALAEPSGPMTFSSAFVWELTNAFHDSLIWIFTIVAVGHAIRFHYARGAALRESQLQAALARAQFDALSSRMQPHFLFNALNSISAMLQRDPEAAERMISRLGDLLRAAMQTEGPELIPVWHELRLVGDYLAIQQIRFADRMRVDVRASDAAEPLLVPRFILQPLVENAVKHGIEPLDRRGTIAVAVSVDGDRLLLTVRNDVPEDLPPAEHQGLGLRHTRARLELLYGAAGALRFTRRGDCVETEIAVPARSGR